MKTKNKNQNHRTIPQVRIGIIQSAQEVCFKCNSDFEVRNVDDEILFTGHPDKQYELQIVNSQPAVINYQLRVESFRTEQEANDKLEGWTDQGFSAKVRPVGLRFDVNETSINNREYWIVVGNFSTNKEAEDFIQENDFAVDVKIVEDIKIKASGDIGYESRSLGNRVRIIPKNDDLIYVENVPIGIEFHWQRQETLAYRGLIEVGFNNSGNLEAVNELDVENYLASVNSSEMTPDCPIALLEAQTVAARSTVFATMGKHHYNTSYHLCSDDHCQCYQGALREQDISRFAMENTYGKVLMVGSEVCDARYSKICGGIIESYDNVWEEWDIPYMVAGIDSNQSIEYPADTEEKAKKFIDDSPDVFCNTSIYSLPLRLANLYSTQNLFRWEVSYEREELEKLLKQKLQFDVGELVDLKPLKRGASGRLIYLEIVGTKKTVKLGKELQIRRAFSKSHLYSSCFYFINERDKNGKLKRILLKGAGWGHGVGLCQVGATVMALKGFSYENILFHYYKNSKLVKLF